MPPSPEDSRTASYESDADSSNPTGWARIMVVHPPISETVIDLHPGSTIIGRDLLTLPEGQRTVSRRHYEIRVEDGRVVGADLDSRNGSSVNFASEA